MDDQLRVLVVDGCRHARLGLRMLLKTTGVYCVVAEAEADREALDAIPIYGPDIVFLDLQLPWEESLQTVRAIKRRWPEIMVVVLTMQTRRRPEVIEAGADAFVSKGDGPARILDSLDSLIRRSFATQHVPT
jgi:DNA-binding NarL/FixJ family response regulator